jgi:hypothetical protein
MPHCLRLRILAAFFGSVSMIAAQSATPPGIRGAPANVTETLRGAASFVVDAVGSSPLAFQWYHDGALLAGETQQALIRAPLTAADEGSYAVTVSNSAGSVTSNTATLNLLPAPAPIVDETFRADAALAGIVVRLLPLPDGSLIVATEEGRSSRVRKLRANGTLDPAWTESAYTISGSSSSAGITALVLQADGKIFVGGTFTSVNGRAAVNLIRLGKDGTIDPSFAAAAEIAVQPVFSMALQPNQSLLVANNGTTPLRLLGNGQLDPDFHPAPQAAVAIPSFPLNAPRIPKISQVAVASDGMIYIEGFVDLGTSIIQGPIPSSRVERLNPNGSVAGTFTPVTGTTVALAVLADDSVVVIQDILRDPTFLYTSINIDRRVLRLRADGSPFPQYLAPRISRPGNTYVYPDGRVLYIADPPGLSRLTPLGAVDANFTGGIGSPLTFAATADDHVLVGGDFTFYNGKPANRVARLNTVPNETRNAPRLLRLMADKNTVQAGETVTVRAAVVGSAELTYDWELVAFNTITQQTALPALPVAFQSPGAQSVRLTVRNPRGTSTTESLSFSVLPAPPVITEQPKTISAQFGREITLAVSINAGAGTCTFDWYRNGQPLTSSSAPEFHRSTLYLPQVTANEAGTYTVVVRNALGVSITSARIELTIADSSRFVNLSTRAFLSSAEQPIIAGFVITGDRRRTVLIRGLGPALARWGVTDPLPDPQIVLFNRSGQALDSNDDWSGATLPAAFEKAGTFPLDNGSKDAALLAELSPGNYTVQLAGKSAQTGTALIEIFEADNIADRLLNLSARVFVGSNATAIAGFSIYGPAQKRVLIRAAGPALAAFGVANALANPRLELRNSSGVSLATNEDWSGSVPALVMTAVGAFPFAAGSRDSALLVTLAPGNYTALVDGVGGASGIVLVEIYEVP